MAERGLTGHGMASAADAAFVDLVEEWIGAVHQLAHPRRVLPRDREAVEAHAWETALAALQLAMDASEYVQPPGLGSYSLAAMESAREAARERAPDPDAAEWLWRMCLVASRGRFDHPELGAFGATLEHPNESTRQRLVEIAWFLHRKLDRSAALAPLLRNVATSIEAPMRSAVVARRLLDSGEDFLAVARAMTPPEDFGDQYEYRLTLVENRGLGPWEGEFFELGYRVRGRLQEALLDVQRARPLGVTRGQAMRIAEEYLAVPGHGLPPGEVESVQTLDEWQYRKPFVWNVDLSDCWIALVRRTRFVGLCSSTIIVVSAATGEVVYAGSANDEG